MSSSKRDLRGTFAGAAPEKPDGIAEALRSAREAVRVLTAEGETRAKRLRAQIRAQERAALDEMSVVELHDGIRELLRRASDGLRNGGMDLELADELDDAANAKPLPPLRSLEEPAPRRASKRYTPADRILLDAAAALRRGRLEDDPKHHAADAELADELESLVPAPETVRIDLPRTAALVILDHLARRPRSTDRGPTDARALEEWLELSYARLINAEAIANARLLAALYPEQTP